MAQGNTKLARGLVWFAAFVSVALLLMMCSLASMGAAWLLALLLMMLVDGPVALYAYQQGLFFEMGIQRTWSAVCRNLGGNFSAEVFSLGNSVRAGLESRGKYYVPNQTKTVYPRLREVRGTREAWTGLVKPNPGQTINDYQDQADAYALAYHSAFCQFELAEKGLIRIRVGQMPIPEAYDFEE